MAIAWLPTCASVNAACALNPLTTRPPQPGVPVIGSTLTVALMGAPLSLKVTIPVGAFSCELLHICTDKLMRELAPATMGRPETVPTDKLAFDIVNEIDPATDPL